MTRSKNIIVAIGVVAALVACGGEAPIGPSIGAELETPAEREARITVTPALDVSALYSRDIADRITVEEITINLADARLLGADPRIPAGGLALLEDPRIVAAYGSDDPGIFLPFPEFLLSQEDLAVYVRVDHSLALDGASVVVRGRIYANPVKPIVSNLTSAPDPDGEPAMGDETEMEQSGDTSHLAAKAGSGSIDPDGEPAYCAPDPDGEPAKCGKKRNHLVSRGEEQASLPFELRGEDVADLVAGLDARSSFDIIIGIPAANWFTPEAMAEIDRKLAGQAEPKQDVNAPDPDRDPYVLSAKRDDRAQAGHQRMQDQGDYFLSDDPGLGRLKVRRPE